MKCRASGYLSPSLLRFFFSPRKEMHPTSTPRDNTLTHHRQCPPLATVDCHHSPLGPHLWPIIVVPRHSKQITLVYIQAHRHHRPGRCPTRPSCCWAGTAPGYRYSAAVGIHSYTQTAKRGEGEGIWLVPSTTLRTHPEKKNQYIEILGVLSSILLVSQPRTSSQSKFRALTIL